MSEWCTPWKSWISCFNLLNGLNLQPPATQIHKWENTETANTKDCKLEKQKTTKPEKNTKEEVALSLCYGCLWVLRLASLMTADLDAQPRLTKHFDSPFVVRLRLCFSPFFYCLFIVQVFAKDPWCLLSIASYYHYPCCSHETTRLSIYVLSGQGGFLAFHHCGVYPCS